jgi:hypothetical protein
LPRYKSYTAIQCTGNNLTADLTTRLNNFAHFPGISSVFMTEGSWMENSNFGTDTGSALYSDMRAYVARYNLVMAATTSTGGVGTLLNVNRQYWLGWVGNVTGSNPNDALTYGSLCEDGSSTNSWAPF